MIDLSAALLKALAGSSAQQPVAMFQLAGKLPGPLVPEAEIAAALFDLVERRAINTARLSADGAAWRDVYWLTGVPPAPMPRGITIHKHTQADARAAHETQARAEASRAASALAPTDESPPAPPFPKGGNNQENPMPRIAKPAQPATTQATATQPTSMEPPTYRRAPNGAVQAQVYAALAGRTRDTAALADELVARCPAASGIDSLKSTLRALARSGRIHEERRPIHGVLRGHYWPLEGADGVTPNVTPNITPAPLNDGHERNLATIRRLAGEDRVAGAGKTITPTTAPDPGVAAAQTLDLDADEAALRFALWDNGTLMLTQGDEILALPKADARRLAAFLGICMEVTQ